MKSPESRDEILEVCASPLQHAQEMDRCVSIVLADVLRQLLNPAKAPHVDQTIRSNSSRAVSNIKTSHTACSETTFVEGVHSRTAQLLCGEYLPVKAEFFAVPALHILWNTERRSTLNILGIWWRLFRPTRRLVINRRQYNPRVS